VLQRDEDAAAEKGTDSDVYNYFVGDRWMPAAAIGEDE
jgi:hypothetical protein